MKKKMKTFFSWIGGIFIGLVLLTMCGVIEEEETDKKAEPKTEQAETKPKTEAKPKEKTAEEKAAEEKAAVEVKRIEENEAYRVALESPFSKFGESTSTLSAQTTALSENQSLRFNKEWVDKTVFALIGIEQAAKEIKAIQPTNEQTKAIQDLLNGVADHYIYVVDNYPVAIDNMDINLINSITDETRKANEKLNEAILLMENLNNPME